jgi:MFS family permease
MGGEWSLGVALVMELWPERSRSLLAGLIGAAANVGYMLIALVGLGLSKALPSIETGLLHTGLAQSLVGTLVGNSGWRLLFMIGALPALLTFLIRLYVPESERWRQEQGRGTTAHWATRDLLGVLIGSAAACAIIVLWKQAIPLGFQMIGTVAALVVATLGYLFPVIRYLQRHCTSSQGTTPTALAWQPTVRRMLLGACLGGVALLGTWGSMQWAAPWADKLTGGQMPEAKEYTQLCAGVGAVVGTIGGALLGGWLGRRITYTFLCLGSLGAALLFFLGNQHYGPMFLVLAFVAGMFTASFYGWLPLYLPELFPTRVRATGQGFSYNFGRILATVGVLQTGALMGLFEGSYPRACSIMSLIYLVGVAIIWLAPETHGKPLPE